MTSRVVSRVTLKQNTMKGLSWRLGGDLLKRNARIVQWTNIFLSRKKNEEKEKHKNEIKRNLEKWSIEIWIFDFQVICITISRWKSEIFTSIYLQFLIESQSLQSLFAHTLWQPRTIAFSITADLDPTIHKITSLPNNRSRLLLQTNNLPSNLIQDSVRRFYNRLSNIDWSLERDREILIE